MASKLLRRSGVGVALVCDTLKWQADCFVQVGVGVQYEEIDVLIEEWKLQPDQIVGFEADPEVYQCIRPRFPGSLVNVAVSDKAGEVIIYHKIKHPGGSSLYPFLKSDERIKKYTVRADTIDNLIPNVSPERKILFWVDCEGHELNVLTGAEQFVRHVDVINVEMSMKPQGIGWCDPNDVHQWILDHDFYAAWVHTHRVCNGQVDYVYVKPHLFRPEYCCFPWERERFKCRKTI
jgi:FkbM family methyltransferase